MDLPFISLALLLVFGLKETVSQSENLLVRVLDPRIIGGEDARPNQFPYQVSLRTKDGNNHFCGGTIISRRHILTAAHCIDLRPDLNIVLKPNDINVFMGSNSLSVGGSFFSVEVIHVHKSYSRDNRFRNDIAVIKLSLELDFTSSIQNITRRQELTPAQTSCVTSGWGITTPTSVAPPDILKFVTLPIFDHNVCKAKYTTTETSFVTDNMICLGETGKGACSGDSGGPLVCGGTLAGITSFGVDCGSDYPPVYTEVYKYYDWITDAMNGAQPVLPLSLFFFALLQLSLHIL